MPTPSCASSGTVRMISTRCARAESPESTRATHEMDYATPHEDARGRRDRGRHARRLPGGDAFIDTPSRPRSSTR
jgi:hypothetical protein